MNRLSTFLRVLREYQAHPITYRVQGDPDLWDLLHAKAMAAAKS